MNAIFDKNFDKASHRMVHKGSRLDLVRCMKYCCKAVSKISVA